MPEAKNQLPCDRSMETAKIEYLARLVHPRDDQPKIFAMLDAYLDESGIHDQAAVCIIAGYYAGKGQWKKFEAAWKQLLDEHEVPPAEFHAKDLVKGYGFFSTWNRDKVQNFQMEICRVIASQRKIHPVNAAVIVADFMSFPEKHRRILTGASLTNGVLSTSGCPTKPYFLPFQHCMRHIACYAPTGGRAHFFFGLGKTFSEYAEPLFAQIKESSVQVNCKERLGTIAFPSAKETPELQAADFFVHLSYKHIIEAHARGMLGKMRPTKTLMLCMQNMRVQEDFGYYDRKAMQSTIDQVDCLSPGWDS